MNKYLLYMFLFFCTIQQFHSQEDGVVALALPVRNSLRFNRFVVNPTFSFVRESNRFASFSNKREWVQFEDAPQTYLFSYSGRFRENIGAGIGLFQQNYGVFSNFGGVVNFAYNAVINRESNFTFGLNAGFYQSGINDGRVVTNVPDPALNNIESNSVITINPGINYGTGFFDFGVSVNNLVAYNLTSSKIIEENPEQGIQPHVMYTGYMNSRGFFDMSKFSALIRSEFKKDETVISGMAMLAVPKGIWAQAGYNTKFGISAGIGLNITKSIAFEYNYEKAAGGFSEFGSSHEFTLAYRFKNDRRFNYADESEETALITPNKRKANVAKRKANSSSDAEFRANRIANAKLKEQRKAQLAQAKKEEVEETKLKQEAEAKAREIASAKAEEESKLKAEKDAKIKLAEQQKQKEAEEKARQLAEAKRKADEAAKKEAARLKAQEQARVKAAEEARLKLEAQKKVEEEARIKAQAEAEIKRLEAQQKAEADKKAKVAEEAARIKAEEEARLKAEQEAQEKARLESEAKAREEAERLKAAQEAQAIAEAKRREAEATVTPEAEDAESKTMKAMAEATENAKKAQQELLKRLSDKVAVKQQDLDDLKEENDLSEKGIFKQPKAFKSVSAENAAIEKLIEDIDKTIEDQEAQLIELEAVYLTRKKKVRSKTDPVNAFYLKEIERLKAEQAKIKMYKKELVANLEDIKVKTEVERRRRIKRAAYDNEKDRYEKDRGALERIKRFTNDADEPLSEADFDFGEQQNDNIKIVKNILNAEPGYYLVIAVHSDVEKRDEFLTKVVSLGQKNIDFFFDVKTNQYYIYHKKFNNINQAKQEMQSNAKQPYDKNTSLVKIEN
ncbi:PorP/SprF family type IX secretion system membrane protein [Hyunsoonleella sp. SJ7]|uniref:PorP/SprF family type IX secretion system membrane protein n=1 Tax=Hyunsoonleella aquatilis TaxID=2762758 RepID=A0A923KJW1_9FLAO|nr:type IX secretion system membrane protein PorP/SprF [Hyunsoonleella aquatilis]MBC3757837.1 PorP/SprF family type IX secretion system membrane protein [Hyunsoonleella aquatilis]